MPSGTVASRPDTVPTPRSDAAEMTDIRELNKYRRIGIAAILAGGFVTIAGALFAHFTGLSELNDVGAEIYPAIPRGWQWVVIGQVISLAGGLVLIAGVAVAFLYQREMTWARASLGATLFTTLMMILYGLVPNEWLTLTQSVWEWTPQRIAITLPKWLMLNNEVSISYAAVKDAVSGIYHLVITGLIVFAMYQWQVRAGKRVTTPKPEPVSPYGRPLTKVGR